MSNRDFEVIKDESIARDGKPKNVALESAPVHPGMTHRSEPDGAFAEGVSRTSSQALLNARDGIVDPLNKPPPGKNLAPIAVSPGMRRR